MAFKWGRLIDDGAFNYTLQLPGMAYVSSSKRHIMWSKMNAYVIFYT